MSREQASAPRRIGLIGVGAMGMAMARNLHARGHQVFTRDVRAAADDEARAAGMTVCTSPRELAARCELIALIVVDAQQIGEVLFGADGVVHAEGGAQTVMLCSTIAPQDTIALAGRLAGHAIATIDAPISGGPARALAGTLSMMLAADAATLAPWEGVLADLAAKRFVVGTALGDAAKAKLVNNLLAGINLVAAAEALALAAKIGLDPRTMFELINASSGASWVFEDRMARALTEDFDPPRAAPPPAS
jgi:putative dehydrogenase